MIVNRPHTGWVDYEEAQPPGRPLQGTSRNLRALTRPGRRIPTSTRHPVASLPDPLRVVRTEETLDTEPNRFVYFALSRWRDIAQRRYSTSCRRKRPRPDPSRGASMQRRR